LSGSRRNKHTYWRFELNTTAPVQTQKYLVVRPTVFSVDQILSFDLYRSTGDRITLYRSREFPFTSDDLKQLLGSGCTELYVPESQRDLFYDHTRRRLPRLLDDPQIPLEEKLDILAETSVNILARMLDNPISSDETSAVVSQCRNHVRMAFLGDTARKSMVTGRAQAPFPIAHAISVTNLALVLGMDCSVAGADQLHELGVGALLHEIGKTQFNRDYYYQPESRKLRDDPRLQQYPKAGRDMLNRTEIVPPGALRAVAEHQERLDGSGFPAKLKDTQISHPGRIVAICDYYDERVNGNDGQTPATPFEALSEMKQANNKFDSDILTRLVEMLGRMSES
jgi:hypothetical protein